jgi:hypothetical protein
MRTGALVLGIIAGLAGLVSAVFALFVGGLGDAFDAKGAGTVVGLGWSALVFSLLGLVGAGSSPKSSVVSSKKDLPHRFMSATSSLWCPSRRLSLSSSMSR